MLLKSHWKNLSFILLEKISALVACFLCSIVSFYQIWLAPFMGGNCRFYPSCSQYAQEALRELPWHRAAILIFKRLLQCRPGGRSGYDPVPLQMSGDNSRFKDNNCTRCS